MNINKYSLFFTLCLLLNIQIVNADPVWLNKCITYCLYNTLKITLAATPQCIDPCLDKIVDAAACTTDFILTPGQMLMETKHRHLNPETRDNKMFAFKATQIQRCCIFGCTACAFGSSAAVCSACGCAGIAATALTASKICASGAIIAPQIPYQISMPIQAEFSIGRPKD